MCCDRTDYPGEKKREKSLYRPTILCFRKAVVCVDTRVYAERGRKKDACLLRPR